MTDGEKWWAKICATMDNRRSKQMIKRSCKPVVDLHGLHIHDAYHRVRHEVDTTHHNELLIITGKSGKINYEFPEWCVQWNRVKAVIPQNGGAYLLKLTGVVNRA